MSKKTENALINWESDANDTGDDMHRHFQDVGYWHWGDISDEGRRIYNLMFSENVEDSSPHSAVFDGIAAQSAHGVYAAFAAALGLDSEVLEITISEWMENQKDLPAPVDWHEFMNRYKEDEKLLRDLRARSNSEQKVKA